MPYVYLHLAVYWALLRPSGKPRTGEWERQLAAGQARVARGGLDGFSIVVRLLKLIGNLGEWCRIRIALWTIRTEIPAQYP